MRAIPASSHILTASRWRRCGGYEGDPEPGALGGHFGGDPPRGDEDLPRRVDSLEEGLTGDPVKGVVAADVLGEEEEVPLPVPHGRGVDAAVALVVVGPPRKLLHEAEDRVGGDGCSKLPLSHPLTALQGEGNAGSAAGGQYRLQPLRKLVPDLHVGDAEVVANGQHVEIPGPLHESLVAEEPRHQEPEIVGRGDECRNLPAVHMENHGELPDDARLLFFETAVAVNVDGFHGIPWL